MWLESFIGIQTGRSTLTVADIFRACWTEYQRRYPVTAQQRKAVEAILACRTALLDGHVDLCLACGYIRISYNS